MATATSTTKTATETVTEAVNKSVAEMPALAQKFREQLVSTVQQGQQFSIDAAQTWVKAVSVLPVMDFPTIPGLAAAPDMQAATKYSFDVASDLLTAQRAYALQMTSALLPAKTV